MFLFDKLYDFFSKRKIYIPTIIIIKKRIKYGDEGKEIDTYGKEEFKQLHLVFPPPLCIRSLPGILLIPNHPDRT